MIHSRSRIRFDEESIDKIFRSLDTSSLPGAAVGIAIRGRPQYRKGFGLASMELPVALTAQTRMRIYSISKHFTCLAYLLFCEEGKAAIDDPIAKYLPKLHPITRRVTMRQLMSNTSGLRDVCEIRWLFSGFERTVPANDLLTLYHDISDVNFDPGAAWCYNNGGFHILSAVIEKIADQSLEEVFRKRIFEPAGMDDTILRRANAGLLGNSAAMHVRTSGGNYEARCLPGELLGEGGIVSSVDDMLRWLGHMSNPVVGAETTWALLGTAQTLRDGSATGYGLGLFRQCYRGADAISHPGGGLGGNSLLVKVPAVDLDIVVFSNRQDVFAPELGESALDACLGAQIEPSRDQVDHINGIFRSPITGRVMSFYEKNGRQMVLVDGMEEWPLIVEGNGVLRPTWASFVNVKLTRNGDTVKPDSIQEKYFGGTDELFPVRRELGRPVDDVSGRYRADAVGVRMTIDTNVTPGHAVSVGRFGSRTFSLERICEFLWRMKSTDGTDWGAILAAEPGGAGVSIRTPRTWALPFRRE